MCGWVFLRARVITITIATEILIIFVPIFLPMLDTFGVNPYFFAMLVALNLQTSFLTPPMAMAAYYLKGVVGDQIELIEIFKREMNKGTSPIGKKLEFITQEMMREANTLGNKLPDLYPIVIEIKSTIDKLRQQVANVE